MPSVVVVSRKWNGDFHRRTVMIELGTDIFGTWLWMPEGTKVEMATKSFAAAPALRLIPIGAMWSVYFVLASPARGRPKQLYVDITTPATRTGSLIEFIDLDLDVSQFDEGPVQVLDRDEFAANARTWDYPWPLVQAAEATCQTIVAAVNNRAAPFDGSDADWWPAATE